MPYAHVVKPGSSVKLKEIDPNYHDGLSEEEALTKLQKLGERISDLQELLYAAKRSSLLIVLQGRDTSGKDGSIRRILGYSNVQSSRVVPFKVPTELEANHDFLWRVHSSAPGKGDLTIFNRSHYEDVLVVRVHKLIDKKTCKRRFADINSFERMLVENGTLILKIYLHISKDEQRQRLLAREVDPKKSWKLSVADWREREFWSDYTEAFEDAIEQCSTDAAPWRIVPANHKWFRDLAIAEAIEHTLRPYEDSWLESLKEQGEKEKKAIEEYRKGSS